MCPFSQNTLPSPDVMTYWPEQTCYTLYLQECFNKALKEMTHFTFFYLFFLPDVLSRPSLDHNPHLQLLCALKTQRQSSHIQYIHYPHLAVVSNAANENCPTYIFRLPQELRVFYLDHSVGSTWNGSPGRHPHHLTWHHCMCGLCEHARTHKH